MKRVFLGGTTNESRWRQRMIRYLDLDYFDPVVDDWTPEAMAEETLQRSRCDFCLYTITPRMVGVFSIAEVVDDSNKRPEKTVFVLLRNDGPMEFTEGQWRSLKAVAKMVTENGGKVFYGITVAAQYLNAQEGKGRGAR